MALEAEVRYEGTIGDAEMIEASTGRQGLKVLLRADLGTVSHVIWFAKPEEQKSDDYGVRQKAKTMTGRAKETLLGFGLTIQDLQNAGFWSEPSTHLVGSPVVFKTSYQKDKDGVIKTDKNDVPWLGVSWVRGKKAKAPVSADAAETVSTVFAFHETIKEEDPFEDPIEGGGDED